MIVNLEELKKYSDTNSLMQRFVSDYIEGIDNSVGNSTLEGLSFIKKGIFDLDEIESYDVELFKITMKELLINLIWMSKSNDESGLYDFENLSEEEYLEKMEEESNPDGIDEKSVYFKTLKTYKYVSKKAKNIVLDTDKLLASESEIVEYFVENSLSLVSDMGEEYNPTITKALKGLNIIK